VTLLESGLVTITADSGNSNWQPVPFDFNPGLGLVLLGGIFGVGWAKRKMNERNYVLEIQQTEDQTNAVLVQK
jgi:hypothetical protein